MHHLIFLPNETRTSPAALSDVGLTSHSAGAAFTHIDDGPENLSGMLVHWDISKVPDYAGPSFDWLPAVASYNGGQTARYWVGIDQENKPTNRDLIRPDAIFGAGAKLGDGEYWVVPPLRSLPFEFQLQPDGSQAAIIHQRFNTFYLEGMRQLSKIDGDRGEFDFGDMVMLAEMALDFNYRLPRELADHLRLYNSDTVMDVFAKITGLEVRANVAKN